MRVGDIHFDRRTITVPGKGGAERQVLFGSKALDSLRSYLEKRFEENWSHRHHDALFVSRSGKRLHRQDINRILHSLMLKAGVAKPLSAHKLRHAFATHLISGGASLRSVQKLLGHKQLETTTVYTRVSLRHLVKTYDRAHPRARKKRQR